MRQGNKKGAMMGDSRKPYPEYTCTKNDDGSYTHTFNYESNDDSLSNLYCTFCQQEERRLIAPNVVWCQNCGSIAVGQPRYCNAPQWAVDRAIYANQQYVSTMTVEKFNAAVAKDSAFITQLESE